MSHREPIDAVRFEVEQGHGGRPRAGPGGRTGIQQPRLAGSLVGGGVGVAGENEIEAVR